MKLLLVSDFFPNGKELRFSGGVEARTFFVAKNLAKNNQVTVICSRQPNTKEKEKMFNFTVMRIGSKMQYNSGSPNIWEFPKRIIFIISAVLTGIKLDVDIVDGGNFSDHFIARQIGIIKKIPVVFWYPDVFLGQWVQTSGFLGGLMGFLLEKFNLIVSAQAFIAISHVTKNKLLKVGVKSEKIRVIPCGVDFKEFQNHENKSKPDEIISIARLVNYKNIQDLLDAFSILLKRKSNIKLTIIGSGPEKSSLKEKAKNLKIAHKVSFFENLPREDLIKKLKRSKVFCLPSAVEGFGISVIEAAAAGTPYVISNIKVFEEITQNGKGGILFPLGDAHALSRGIEKLLTNESLYQTKKTEGEKLAANYNWNNISKQTELAYKGVLKSFKNA